MRSSHSPPVRCRVSRSSVCSSIGCWRARCPQNAPRPRCLQVSGRCRSQAAGRSDALQDSDSDSDDDRSPRNRWLWFAACVFGVGLTAAAACQTPSVQQAIQGCWVQTRGALHAFPGFVESLTLIFMSEIGDKTFFIAALLAAKVGRIISFVGSMIALVAMTLFSVAVGILFAKVPTFVHSSLPIGQYLGAAMLCYFGIRSIVAGINMSESDDGDELMEAEEEMQEAERTGRIHVQTSFRTLWEVTSVVFLAEFGDRSMMATIALAAQCSPAGVIIGASLGHGVATVIAVVVGALASRYVSEKVVNLVGGSLFLLFAVETALGLGVF